MGQGSNSSGLRQYNQRAVLAALRQLGVASKAELARETGLTPQGVTRIVVDLESAALVRTQGKRMGKKGQPSLLYDVNPDGAYTFGAKVGRSDLELVLSNFGGQVLQRRSQTYKFADPKLILEALAEGVRTLSETLEGAQRDRLLGIGLAMPWFLNEWTEESGIPKSQATQWGELDLVEAVNVATDLPVFVENDCSAGALAELQLGVGARYQNYLYVNIDTIIGGGLVLDGELHTGVHGNAGAIASMPVPPSTLSSTPKDSNENLCTLMDRASLFVLLRHLNVGGVSVSGVTELADVIDANRSLVQEWLEDAADALGFAFVGAIGLLDLDAIVVEARLPRYLLAELVHLTSKRVKKRLPSGVFTPDMVAGELGVSAVAIGGAMLPVNARFAPDKTILLKGVIPDRVKSP